MDFRPEISQFLNRLLFTARWVEPFLFNEFKTDKCWVMLRTVAFVCFWEIVVQMLVHFESPLTPCRAYTQVTISYRVRSDTHHRIFLRFPVRSFFTLYSPTRMRWRRDAQDLFQYLNRFHKWWSVFFIFSHTHTTPLTIHPRND